MGDTVRFPEQLDRRFGVTALGMIHDWSAQEGPSEKPIILDAERSSHSEGIRQIRANIQFATANQTGKVILISSPGPQEGKSTLVANLGIAMAQTGKKTIIIDADVRRPSIHKLFDGVQKEPGLSNHLADLQVDSDSIVQATQVDNLHIISSGPTPPNPGELLGSTGMNGLLRHLEEEYEVVLVDSPPLLIVADGSILASQAAGVIVVVHGLKTRSSALQSALDVLGKTQVRVLGVIITRLKRPRLGYGYTYPHYYSSSYYSYYSNEDESAASVNGRMHEKLARGARKVWSRVKGG